MSNVPFVIDKIVKIEGNRPVYRVTIEGRSFETHNSDDLFYFRRFRKIVFKRVNRFLPSIPTNVWEDYLNKVMTEAEIVEPPEKEEARPGKYPHVNYSKCGRAPKTT